MVKMWRLNSGLIWGHSQEGAISPSENLRIVPEHRRVASAGGVDFLVCLHGDSLQDMQKPHLKRLVTPLLHF